MKLWFYFLLFASSQSHCLADSIKCEDNFSAGNTIEVLPLEALKEDKAIADLFDNQINYLAPKLLSCHVNKADGNNIITSLKWDKGEVQHNSYDPMYSFISFGSHNENYPTVKNQQVLIYTKSASETHYHQLVATMISQREIASRFFMLRYTHPAKKVEPQNIVIILNDPSSSTNNATMNILGFRYTNFSDQKIHISSTLTNEITTRLKVKAHH